MSAALIDILRAHAPNAIVLAPLIGAGLAGAPLPRWMRVAAMLLGLAAAALLAADATARAALAGFDAYAWRTLAAPTSWAVFDPVSGAGAAALSVLMLLCVTATLGREQPNLETRAPLLGIGAAALLTMVLAGDLLILTLAAQVAGLAGAGLIALEAKDPRAARASVKALIASASASIAMLLAVFLFSGALAWADLPAAVRANGPAAPALALIALASVAGWAPFHTQRQAALARMPVSAAALFGVAAPVAAFFPVARLASLSQEPRFAHAGPEIVAGLAILAIVLGSVLALSASGLRRFAAAALLAQIGAALLGVALGGIDGFAAAALHLGAGAVASSLILGLDLRLSVGPEAPLRACDGLARRAPLTALAAAIGALSLIGAPLTAGFSTRWSLFELALRREWWVAGIALVGASLAAAIYAGRLLERLFLRRDEGGAPRFQWRELSGLPLMIAGAGLCLGLGLFATGPLAAARALCAGLAEGAAP